jgi:hypothetical protein
MPHYALMPRDVQATMLKKWEQVYCLVYLGQVETQYFLCLTALCSSMLNLLTFSFLADNYSIPNNIYFVWVRIVTHWSLKRT